MPKNNRLNTKEFQRVFKEGTSLKSSSFFIKYLANDLGYARTGVGVTKNLGKNAVQRNRYKRILRHVLKDILKKDSTGYDIIVIGNEQIKNKAFKNLREEMYELIHKTINLG